MTSALANLPEDEIQRRMTGLNRWQREGKTISREFVLGGFAEAARFINRIAPIADAMDHHPDLQLYRYKRVKVTLTTHSTGGLTRNDFELAAKIDALASET